MSEELMFAEFTEVMQDDLESLSRLLVEVVADGASIGFLPPLSQDEAQHYWSQLPAPDVFMWVAHWRGDLVGSVQLHLCQQQNGTHRAEIAKLMVHPNARRKGIGQKLMSLAEDKAKSEGRSLLVLDTRAGDPSNVLYRSLGYVEAGRIPYYSRSADGTLQDTIIYYKSLVLEHTS